MRTKLLLILLYLLPSSLLLGQEGLVSGTLLDNDGLPIPGVNIIIQGTTTGTQTDFDGNYSITCKVGDVLLFTYLGFRSKEVKVTADLFGTAPQTKIQKSILVQLLIQSDYVNQIKRNNNPDFEIPDINSSNKNYTFNRSYFDYSRIKSIESDSSKVRVKIYPRDTYFEIGVNHKSSFQFVQNRNLPLLQNRFAQGRPVDESLTWQGPETGEIFSYGPRIANLEFSDEPYTYDINGPLVPRGDGNGIAAAPYDNQIFRTGLNTYSAFKFNAHSGVSHLDFNYINSNTRDLFDRAGNKSNFLDVGFKNRGDAIQWDAGIKFSNNKAQNANINALHNQVYFSSFITPPTFSNKQGFILGNNQQRSFSPQNYNNPDWLLERNGNVFDYSLFKANLNNKFYPADNLNLETGIAFSKQSEIMQVRFPQNTNGFNEGYSGRKDIDTENFSFDLAANYYQFNLSDGLYVRPYSSIGYSYSRLDYSLLEQTDFQELNSLLADPSKSTLQLKNRLELEAYFDFEILLTLQNNSFTSSIQGEEWLLPSAKIFLKLDNDLFGYSDFFTSISLSGGYSKDVVDLPLYYSNFSHNSLQLEVGDRLSYTTNNDLFASSELDFEEVSQFDLETKLSFFNNRATLAATYYRSMNDNSIFPVFTGGNWELQNIASIKNQGFESSLEFFINSYYDTSFRLNTKFIFSFNRPVVERIYDESLNRVPIAGFPGISKNLIEGQPSGILVGSAFQRNEDNEIVIGDDGFPLIDPEQRILGNPIPNYNLGWTTTIGLQRFNLNFLFDYQRGGDIWNGTQNTLNYFGVSEETARLRQTTDYIFPGVNQQGIINTIPVAFAAVDSEVESNRWVRYGFDGIAEEAIADGSYLNLKSISLSYTISNDSKDVLFKEMVFGLFAKNIWTWTKTRGANPYGQLFGNASAQGLNFFNLPLVSEVGFNIHFKI